MLSGYLARIRVPACRRLIRFYSDDSQKIDPELVESAKKAAAEAAPGNEAETAGDLMSKLKSMQTETETAKKSGISGMMEGVTFKVSDKSGRNRGRKSFDAGQKWSSQGNVNFKSKELGRSQFRPSDSHSVKQWVQKQQKEIDDIFARPALGIFDKVVPSQLEKTTWDHIVADRITLLKDQGPSNGFQQEIEWTKEGKMWKYPIDNEADWTEEEGVSWQDHVILQPMLDELEFPKTGPIREFMELVTIGLSQNPHMTVAKKHEYLRWFEDFFRKRGPSIQRLYEDENISV